MDDTFDLPITYKNQELTFRTKLLHLGYIHKFEVEVYDSIIIFETDEEGNYRATLVPSKNENNNKIDIEILKLIAESLEFIEK